MSKHYPRLFIGLDLAAKDKLSLQQWREKHLRGLSDRPVPAENFHITLSFLGQVPPNKMESLHQHLSDIKAHQLQLNTTDLGCFHKAQILYLGVNLTESLNELAQQCLQINKALGLPTYHSKYRPHITLTRKHKELVPIEALPPEMTLTFEQFHLFESVPSKKPGTPPHYPKRLSFDLIPHLRK